MRFSDEFEYEVDGIEYNVSVEGEVNRYNEVSIDLVTIYCGDESIDEDHRHYDEIKEEALGREYTPEVDSRDFDYYEHDFNGFLKEKDPFTS